MKVHLLIAISAALTVAAAGPAVWGLLRGAANLRISSWGIWTAAQLVGGFSALTQHQYPAAVYVLFCAGECGLVAVLAWRNGDRHFGLLDGACVILAAAGLVLLVVVKAPGPAVVVSVATDIVAYLPTIRHARTAPEEEPAWSYFIYGLGAGILLPAADWHVLTAVAYPLYLVVLDTAVAVLIWTGRRRRLALARTTPLTADAFRATVSGSR